MKKKYVRCALRSHRQSWGLSQHELAGLLGCTSEGFLSLIEQGKRTPRLETALACTALFGVSLQELFPQLAAEITRNVRERATHLQEGYVHNTTPLGFRKRRLLRQACTGNYEANALAL